MKKLAVLALGGLTFGTVLGAHSLGAADAHPVRVRVPTSAAALPALGDIEDVYAWMSTDGSKLNLAMTVSPADDGTQHFGPGVQYVFHVTSKSGAGVLVPGGTETTVLCTFASDSAAQCWVNQGATVKAYVAGDPRSPAGLTNGDGKLRLFAGRRSDPAFFNLQGFRDAIALLAQRLALTGPFTGSPAVTFDAARCPNNLSNADLTTLRGKLQEGAQALAGAPCATDRADCFAHANVLAIVLQLDKSLINVNPAVLAVWGSTHTGT